MTTQNILTQEQRNAIIISIITIMSVKSYQEVFTAKGIKPYYKSDGISHYSFIRSEQSFHLEKIKAVIAKFKGLENVTVDEIILAVNITGYNDEFPHSELTNLLFSIGRKGDERYVHVHEKIIQAIIHNQPELFDWC